MIQTPPSCPSSNPVNQDPDIFLLDDYVTPMQWARILCGLWPTPTAFNPTALARARTVTRKFNEHMKNTEKALKLKAELDVLRPLAKEDELRIMQKFRLDWNYHSNHLEGNSLTYGETKTLILFGITAQGKPLKDHLEISGHDEAVNWIMDVVKKDRDLTENFIRELHKLILKKTYEVDAITSDGKPTRKRVEVGRYRSTPNHVMTNTGEIFRFAGPEETPALMNDLLNWYKAKNKEPFNPVLVASEFHYRFIRIHPFDDGNGRIARILMNFILMQSGLPPVIIKTDDKAGYFSVLRQADAGTLEPFVEYIAGGVINSLEIMIKGAKGESIEDPDDFDKQFSLLEQKLNRISRPIEVIKSKERVLEVFEKSVKPLANRFIKKAEKFEKFYLEKGAFQIVAKLPWAAGWVRCFAAASAIARSSDIRVD